MPYQSHMSSHLLPNFLPFGLSIKTTIFPELDFIQSREKDRRGDLCSYCVMSRVHRRGAFLLLFHAFKHQKYSKRHFVCLLFHFGTKTKNFRDSQKKKVVYILILIYFSGFGDFQCVEAWRRRWAMDLWQKLRPLVFGRPFVPVALRISALCRGMWWDLWLEWRPSLCPMPRKFTGCHPSWNC